LRIAFETAAAIFPRSRPGVASSMVVLVSSTPQYERPEEGGADGATRRTSCVPNHRTLCAPRFPSYNRRTVPERPRVASVLTAGRRGSRSGPPPRRPEPLRDREETI